jgi:heme A synthase
MNVSWKSLGTRARIGSWPPMVWATLALILFSAAATVIVGVNLYAATEHPAQFSNK